MLRWSLAHRGIIVLICMRDFFFDIWSVPSGWARLDSRGRPGRAAEFLYSARRHLAGKDERMAPDMAGKIVALPEVAFVEAFTHGPTNHAHLFIGLVPRSNRKAYARADGGSDARNSRRTIATLPITCGCLPCWAARFISRLQRNHSRAGSHSVGGNQQEGCRPHGKVSGTGGR